MDNIQKLEKNGREARILVPIGQVAPVVEAVSKGQPLLLNENSEPL